jgi:hypothetical protein
MSTSCPATLAPVDAPEQNRHSETMTDALPMQCSACGRTMRPELHRSLARRLVRWFNNGRVPAGQRSYRCDNCGMATSFGVLYARQDGAAARLRELYGRLSLQPVPRFYAVMASGGLVVGALRSFLLSWPWRLGPIAVVVGGWVFMTSSALWHPAGAPGPSGRQRD